MERASSRKQTFAAIALVVCVLLVGFWEVMSNRSRRAFEAFELTHKDFEAFVPTQGTWRSTPLPVSTTPIEPNIVAFRFVEGGSAVNSVIVRLVHGYNMCDCMRIKGYEVALLADSRTVVTNVPGDLPEQLQVWRLISNAGDISIWVTSMLRAGDFSALPIDVRSMAFPRIGMVDDPNWMPQGLTWNSFRHPIANTRMMLRAKWNNARCDIWTFLRLKQPAWASDDMLTLVSTSRGASVSPAEEPEMIKSVINVHMHMLRELQTWRRDDTE